MEHTKHFTRKKQKKNQKQKIKCNTTSKLSINNDNIYNLMGIPRQTSLHIHGIYIYAVILDQYIITIYILHFFDFTQENSYKKATRTKHTSPRMTTGKARALPTFPLFGKICHSSFLGCRPSTSSQAL